MYVTYMGCSIYGVFVVALRALGVAITTGSEPWHFQTMRT